MKNKIILISLKTFFLILFQLNILLADIVKKIEIQGNDRISKDTIKLFSR